MSDYQHPDDDAVSAILGGAVEQLDLPAEILRRADLLHADIGTYLSVSLPGTADWNFYSQGSARIGTGVRGPRGFEWDLDSVAEAAIDKDQIGKAELKQIVGDALRGYASSRADDDKLAPRSVDPGRRCWTLQYDGFHIDVLPGVGSADGPPGAIWITDRGLVRWQPSNPRGYASWFERRMKTEFDQRRVEMAKEAKVEIEDIPAWSIKTTLQRSVQVLKLHANSYFANDLDRRPPSCVITTLAAKAYRGQSSLADALVLIASGMPRFVETDGGLWIVENPAHPGDNLADRWSAQPGATTQFQPWLDDVRKTIEAAQQVRTGMPALVNTLATRFDTTLLSKSAESFASRQSARRDRGTLSVSTTGALTAAAGGGTLVKPHTFHGRT
ncbi:MAG: nucleotidyltransferase [Ilumatobacteraceae bacterium]